tara:strand:- start:44208 stop:44522 length:315 start_codon:yes stop_codon:yes gene_type:complete
MAKNYVQDGNVLTFTAPSGGVVSGNAYVIGAVACVSLVTVEAGDPFTGRVTGVFDLPCASGLTEGAAVGLLAGELVAAGTESSLPFGKLTADEAGGTAPCRLSN